MEAAILMLALLFVAFVALGAYAGVKAVRAAKRGVERTVTQARRTVEDTTLRAKSMGQLGVAGELAQLRLSLRTSMRATQDALRAGVAEDASLTESLALFERLSAHGHELDEELRRLEREPDRTTVSAKLPDLRERVEKIVHSAESLRWAARDRAQRFADDDLDTLSAQIDMEAGALRHWTDSAETGAAPTVSPASPATPSPSAAAPSSGAPTASTAGSGAPGVPGASHPYERPAAHPYEGAAGQPEGEGAADETGPRAITARDPRTAQYPWEKSARPETTN
ncbi:MULTISPECIES: hypothetical protein [Streptomyces]|uniref:Secreted protein n=1 Tax=Streptomyces tsukubensis (strain DSM 42081 / NBRC 108919 / NRRL 18488 / 9993) TaxID=1114943 RepID=I2MY41_STRT9|nr:MULTISPECIES: hypothetical protein [Streptomyces]AZK94021.1 hypothetical protein B7R87_09140 [Streptomyces tsukubensis]EIF89688.1 hypothetical protein [Streptomyces tsukubensis NRRL18488]MYS67205.1 hypothetical protein [Streptomyces sp. SID5473]QKM69865.1 hypothetical protein STSU_024670 [Streptomyces tsukubensis NRRL18488]TAI46161.1 hypothetical protein EWI31_03490 [Streptomyces tsukubensis]